MSERTRADLAVVIPAHDEEAVIGRWEAAIPMKRLGTPEEIAALVRERAEARKNKDWARSDELRNRIVSAGYILEDTKQGQKVRKDV